MAQVGIGQFEQSMAGVRTLLVTVTTHKKKMNQRNNSKGVEKRGVEKTRKLTHTKKDTIHICLYIDQQI